MPFDTCQAGSAASYHGHTRPRDAYASEGTSPTAHGSGDPIQAQKFLSGMNYPASKNEIVQHVDGQGANADMLFVLRRIPYCRYDGPNVVSREISEAR